MGENLVLKADFALRKWVCEKRFQVYFRPALYRERKCQKKFHGCGEKSWFLCGTN